MGVWRYLGNIRTSWRVSTLEGASMVSPNGQWHFAAVSVPREATATAEPALDAASPFLLDSRATLLDRAVSKRVEKGQVQWRDQLFRDQ